MKRVLLIIATAALTVSCYLSELSNTTHPDMGMVVVNKIMPDDAMPPSNGYTILFYDQTYTTYDSTTTIDAALEPGVYTLYVYNNLSDMSMDHDVDLYGEGTIISSKVIEQGKVNSLSEDLYFGTETITVLADEIIYSDVLLKQETRDISFNLEIVEGNPENIVAITASLGGIAGQWECIDDIPYGDVVDVNTTFVLGESLTKATTNSFLTSTIKVLGVSGDAQFLSMVLTLANGTTQTIVSEVSDQLVGSNDTKPTPIILSGNLSIDTEFGITGSITDWVESGNDSSFDVEQPY